MSQSPLLRSQHRAHEEEDQSDEVEDEEPFENTFGGFRVGVTQEGKELLFKHQRIVAQMEIRNIVALPYFPEKEDYAGPIFYHLESKLKWAFLVFLRAFGASYGTAAYVEYYSKQRDKELYR